MGWYAENVFPWILRAVEGGQLKKLQAELARQARGEVLELGFGAGQTLGWYTGAVDSLVAIEPNAGFRRIAGPLAEAAPFPVELLDAVGEDLPLDAARFDTAVVLTTLCSVTDLDAVASELVRCLKPGGTVLFVEHTVSTDPGTHRWQERLEPAWMRVGAGCHLTRDPVAAMERAGLEVEGLEHLRLPGTPAIVPFTRGRALKA